MTFKWSVGVTTVPQRRDTILPQTLASLRVAGFDHPRLFVDGWDGHDNRYLPFVLEVTARYPKIGAWGNWFLALHELWVRNPHADRFAIFQDDVIAVSNLRQYLELMPWPAAGAVNTRGSIKTNRCYLNLYTFLTNEAVISEQPQGTWHESSQVCGGNNKFLQTGRGALGLVFDREGVIALLSSIHATRKPLDANKPSTSIDGAVVNAMNHAGFREMVHCPSLVRHTGLTSAIRTDQEGEETLCPYPPDLSFPGENTDALEWLAHPAKVESH